MNHKQFTLTALVLPALLALITACSSAEPAGLSDQQVAAVTEKVLLAINAGDYPAFVQDFSEAMVTAFPQEQFIQLRDLLLTSSGNYLSIGEPALSNSQGYVLYRFRCSYDLEDVIVTVTFAIGGTQVDGLFFDSPNLRSAAQ